MCLFSFCKVSAVRQKLGEPLGCSLDGQPPPVPGARGPGPWASRPGLPLTLLLRLPARDSSVFSFDGICRAPSPTPDTRRHREHSGRGTRTLGSSNPESSRVVTVPPDLPSLCLCPERGPAVRPPPGCSPARPRPSGLSDPARAQSSLWGCEGLPST